MSEPCIIQADYTNWRTVAGRKVLQLILEVPIEQTADVMQKLGVPLPGESRWCAVALLENGKHVSGNGAGKRNETPRPSGNSVAATIQAGEAPSHTTANTAGAGTSETQSRERRPFASLPLPQQAAIRCTDKQFQAFLNTNEDGAAEYVRQYCSVSSRSKIMEGENSGKDWLLLESKFKAWLTDAQYADTRR